MSTVRITSGLYKNQKLAVPKSAHPMGERERTAIFNSLGDKLQGAHILDIFAGSGALGLESLSRGAATATFIDNNREAREIIKQNIKKLGIPAEKVQVRAKVGDPRRAVWVAGSEGVPREEICPPSACDFSRGRREPTGPKHPSDEPTFAPYDIIFADPPYHNPQPEIIQQLPSLLSPTSTLILSLSKSTPTPTLPPLNLTSQKSYSGAQILFFTQSPKNHTP